MNAARSAFFDTERPAASSREDALARMTLLATLLDSAFVIPGLNRRFGLDAVIGLVPGVGDAITALMSAYIIWEAYRLGLPRWKIARMVGNVALDTALGSVPVVGDMFDVVFKSNQRNLRIVREHLGLTPRSPRDIDGTAVRIDER